MAVVVFDADVLVAYLSRDDAHHREAVDRVRRARESGTRALVSAVNYTEILIGPLQQAGEKGIRTVDRVLDRLRIEVVPVDRTIAQRAAAIRRRTKLKLPDAYALATAARAEEVGEDEVRVETFDKQVARAFDGRPS